MTQSESWPSGMDMIHQLWEAVHGSPSTAQSRPPKEVWEELLDDVRALAARADDGPDV